MKKYIYKVGVVDMTPEEIAELEAQEFIPSEEETLLERIARLEAELAAKETQTETETQN